MTEKDETIRQLEARIKELETSMELLSISAFNVIKFLVNR